jgi:hypothetical protein
MKGAAVIAVCALAVAGAFADTVMVGGTSTHSAYPFRGC